MANELSGRLTSEETQPPMKMHSAYTDQLAQRVDCESPVVDVLLDNHVDPTKENPIIFHTCLSVQNPEPMARMVFQP